MEKLGQHWRGGDIANLKPARLFSPDQYNDLLAPGAGSTRGYLDAEACGHPVIIVLRLSKRSTHAMITPISSHGSGRTTGPESISFNLPWARRRNKHRKAEHYRAICDTPRPSTRREVLRLEGDATLPMPTASWVDIQKVWIVPLGVLRRFSIDGGQHWVPRLQRDSLVDLRAHMSEECARWKEHMRRLLSVEPTPAALSVAISPGRGPEVSTRNKRNWAAIVTAAATEPSPAVGKEEQQVAAWECEKNRGALDPSPPTSAPTTTWKSSEDSGSEEVEVIIGPPEASLASLSIPAPGAKDNNGNSEPDVDPDKAAALKPSWASVLVTPAPARTPNAPQHLVFRKRQATAGPSACQQQTGSISPILPPTEGPEIARLTTLQDASHAVLLDSTSTVDGMASTIPSRPDYSLPSAPAISSSATSPGLTFIPRPTAPEFIPFSLPRPTAPEFIPFSPLRPTAPEFRPLLPL